VPKVLTTNALIQCPHLTVGQSVSSDPTWSVDGGFVLVEGDRGLFPPCPSQVQCNGYTLRSMGLNATQIKGKKVILATDFNQTDSGLPLTIQETQNKVKDDTSPAPIPDGQDAPPLPPPLADETKPSVVVAPPGPLVFSLAAGPPPTLGATFTLTSAHPLKWILTLIHDVPGGSVDRLNDSQPAGLTLTPSDSAWNVSPLTISLSMTKAYMGTLVAGAHRFFMTGVSQRGISKFVELVLTVNP
jgi:hypothetical protein